MANERSKRLPPAATGIATGLGLLVAGLIAISLLNRPNLPRRNPLPQPVGTKSGHDSPPVAAVSTDERGNHVVLIDDDGATQWVSPTERAALSLAWLPPGGQLFVVCRPADLLATAEGRKLIEAIGPSANAWLQELAGRTGLSLSGIERLLVSLEIDAGGNLQTSLVIRPKTPVPPRDLAAMSSTMRQVERGGRTFYMSGDRAYLTAEDEFGQVMTFTSTERVADLITLDGAPPPLRSELERIASHLDDGRHLSVLFAPNFFNSNSVTETSDATAAVLRDVLDWWLGRHVHAVGLSAQWDRNFFIEARVAYTADRRPAEAAGQALARLREAPGAIAAWIARSELSPYGRRVLEQLPAMIDIVASHTRATDEHRQSVLRCYLPLVAGHNLALAAQLSVLEARLQGSSPAQIAADGKPESVAEKLAVVTTLRFPRETLQSALRQLEADLGVSIQLAGSDLEVAGITQNQSFGMDVRNRPAWEILTEILRAANPDRTATGPADDRQSLVFVVRPQQPGGPDVIIVTTRSAALARGETIEAPFVANE